MAYQVGTEYKFLVYVLNPGDGFSKVEGLATQDFTSKVFKNGARVDEDSVTVAEDGSFPGDYYFTKTFASTGRWKVEINCATYLWRLIFDCDVGTQDTTQQPVYPHPIG